MNPTQIIETIRMKEKDPTVSIPLDVFTVLFHHKCFYLCHNNDSWNVLSVVANKVAIKERLKVCLPLFHQTIFPYAIVKGAILSQTMYDDPFVRASGDIDVLILRKDIELVKSFLSEHGFFQGHIANGVIAPYSREELLYYSVNTHQLAPYIKITKSKFLPYVSLDLNMDITWGENKKKTNMDYVFSFTEPIQLFGTTITKLKPEMEFVCLCLHHYKDINSLYILSERGIRLGQYCEIYEYLKKVHPNPRTISTIVEHLDIGQYVYTCLLQIWELFEDSCITPYLTILEQYKDPLLINSFGLNDEERMEWPISLLERIFHPNLPAYLWSIVSESAREKILINRKYI